MSADYVWTKLPGPAVDEKVRYDGGIVSVEVKCSVEVCFNSSPMQMRSVNPLGVPVRAWFIMRYAYDLPGHETWVGVPKAYQKVVEHEFSKFMADFMLVSVPIYDKDGRMLK